MSMLNQIKFLSVTNSSHGSLTIIPSTHNTVAEGGVASPRDGVVSRQFAGSLSIVEKDGLFQGISIILLCRASSCQSPFTGKFYLIMKISRILIYC